jgi:hypothetical protein
MFNSSNIQKVEPFIQIGLDKAADLLKEKTESPVSFHMVKTSTSFKPDETFLSVKLGGDLEGQCFMSFGNKQRSDLAKKWEAAFRPKEIDRELCDILTKGIMGFISSLCQGEVECSIPSLGSHDTPREELISLSILLEVDGDMFNGSFVIDLAPECLSTLYECLHKRGDLLRRSVRVPIEVDVNFEVRIERDESEVYLMNLRDESLEGLGGMLTSDGRASALPRSGDILLCERGRFILRRIIDEADGGFSVGLERIKE